MLLLISNIYNSEYFVNIFNSFVEMNVFEAFIQNTPVDKIVGFPDNDCNTLNCH